MTSKEKRGEATPPPERAGSLNPFTPRTPYRSFPCTPSDSPTNPFRRRRRARDEPLALPEITSFGKHLPLRVRLIRGGLGSQSKNEGEGVYRVVQVPTNYTFQHLRALLLYMFGGHPEIPRAKSRYVGTSKQPNADAGASSSKAPARQGHVFEVMNKATLRCRKDGVPDGVIESGTVWAKLRGAEDEDEDENESDGERGWRWESEEDIRVGNIWPLGLDLHCGAIYHHDSEHHVHITINTSPLPKRQGSGNEPFVFCGRGLVYLPSELGDLLDFEPDKNARRKTRDLPGYDLKSVLPKWNMPGAFGKYLERFSVAFGIGSAGALLDETRSTSSLPPSSPVASSYSSRASPFESEPESPSAGALLPATPEPQERKKRVRVKRAQRTIARLAKRFREDEEGIFGQSFNEDGKEEGGKQVDELAGDPVSAG